MRTDHDLRETLRTPGDGPDRAERLYARILAGTRTPARPRRPALVLVVAALMAAVLAGVALTSRAREAAPVDPPTSPAAERVPGHWGLVARVDLPPGWRVIGRSVDSTEESIVLAAADGLRSCTTTVWSRDFRPLSWRRLDDVTVNGRPALESDDGKLYWYYRPDAVADVACTPDSDLRLARSIAERMVFEPTAMRVPLRLLRAPAGYRVDYVSDNDEDPGAPSSLWSLTPEQGRPGPIITLRILAGESNLTRRSTAERTTIAGRPAWLVPGRIDLDAGSYLISVDTDDPAADRWARGERELLVQLAESLEPAPDPGNRATWFDAEVAVPS